MRTIPRKITITPMLNGYSVQVGCQTLVFNDGAFMLRELQDYLRSPEEVEKRYSENAMHRDFLKNECPAPETIRFTDPLGVTSGIGGLAGQGVAGRPC